METSIYSIIPAGNKPLYFLYAILGFLAVVLISVGALLTISIRGSQHATFELSPTGLHLRGDLYGRHIPATELLGGGARIVDLRHEPELRPKSRRLGTGIPGYGSGWFRLANGQKALIYLTDQTRVVLVPTTDNYVLLLSVERPVEFVNQLRQMAAGT